jgi:hypothetical protein
VKNKKQRIIKKLRKNLQALGFPTYHLNDDNIKTGIRLMAETLKKGCIEATEACEELTRSIKSTALSIRELTKLLDEIDKKGKD